MIKQLIYDKFEVDLDNPIGPISLPIDRVMIYGRVISSVVSNFILRVTA